MKDYSLQDLLDLHDDELEDFDPVDEFARYCYACSGSGEGSRDGTVCNVCRGKGR